MAVEGNWHDATIEISRGGSIVAVIAFVTDSAPGLAVHSAVGDDARIGRYAVTHVASGAKIGLFALKQGAMAAAEALAPLTDWRRKPDDLRADQQLRAKVAEAMRAEGALA